MLKLKLMPMIQMKMPSLMMLVLLLLCDSKASNGKRQRQAKKKQSSNRSSDERTNTTQRTNSKGDQAGVVCQWVTKTDEAKGEMPVPLVEFSITQRV